LGIMATAGRKAREEFRDKINILIDSQIRSDNEFREKIKILTDSQNKTEEITRENSKAISENSKAIKAVNEQLQAVAIAQAELSQSQKLTDRALRDYLNSLPRRKNGNSSN
jgi:DNA polymerase III alpha subunit (gram-positive type)